MTFGAQTATTTVTPQEKLTRMAAQLAQHQLDAYYVSPEDEHLNEYLPDSKKRIEWMTGFTGESAPMLVTPQRIHVYADGRFHLQVDAEVDASVVEAHKVGAGQGGDQQAMETAKKLATGKPSFRVGYDPFLMSPRRMKELMDELAADKHITLVPVAGNLVDSTWTGRPALPSDKAYSVDAAIVGKTVQDKLTSVREDMKKAGADVLPVTKLDEVAWLFNIRGKDIPFNPVLESYAMVTPDQAYLFAPAGKVPQDVETILASQGVTLKDYNEYQSTLTQVLSNGPRKKVLLDNGAVTLGTKTVVEKLADVVEADNPVTWQKAIKNPTEIDGMLRANYKASRAIIRHLAETDKAFAQGKVMSEADVRDDLETKYKQEADFVDLSFPTIPGIGPNSAIIHYSHANPDSKSADGKWYLLDSGCQYTGGTTDTTRTTVFGTPTAEQIHKYTAVLKAHIGGASLTFPAGTTGIQIDACTRQTMWNEGLNFAHGTGHGVGAFLNVHEGPNRINYSPKTGLVAFKPGMITSIEPGYYEANWGGIRLENLYYVAEDTAKPPFQGVKWFKFETLTFVPFEKKLIDFNALTAHEKNWLKTYNQKVWDKLHASLNPEEQAWLKDQCQVP